jgi:hypothetical protein
MPFLEAAKGKGASDESLVRLLEERGWTARRVYRALASYYERQTGLDIPAAPRAGAESARDAFLYLLSFATLGVWIVALGSVLFDLLDRWLPDPVSRGYYQNLAWSISGNLAAILVAFPIFLAASRQIGHDLEAQPERHESGVRKWLTYLALLIAAGVVIGDLITFLAFFLRGELTARFVLKAAAVLALSGGVFWHYLATLKPAPGSRISRRFALAASAAAGIGLALGFWALGSPSGQRESAADRRRVTDLGEVARRVDSLWNTDGRLPGRLRDLGPAGEPLPERFLDPVTRQPYEYRPGAGSKYELCASFGTDTRGGGSPRPGDAYHPAGRHCFSLDAARPGVDPLRR